MAAPAPVDSSAREYLQEKNVAPILEAFVTDLVQERPGDVLLFMSQWAQKGSATVGPSTEGDTAGSSPAKNEDPDAAQKEADLLKLQSLAVRQSWVSLESSEQTAQLAKTFFQVVTAQHASLKRGILKGADMEFLEVELLKLLDGVVKGTIPTEEVQAAAATYGLGKGLESRHYHYFITGMLSALSIHLKEDYSAVSEAWRVILTEITNIVQTTVEQEIALENERDDSIVKDENGASKVVVESWEKISDKKKNVGDQFFNLLLLQHSSLKRTVFKGVDMNNASEKLVDLLDGVVKGSVSSDFLESLGVAHCADYGVDGEKHGPYFITAMLMTLKMALGDSFDAVAEPWRLVLTGITDSVSRGADKLEAQQTMSVEVGDPKAEEAGAQEAGSGGDLVKDNWSKIADKKEFCKLFLKLISTQHPVVQRSLLKEIDEENLLSEFFVPLMDMYITGSLSDEEIKTKALEYGADKKMQERFYHYFITAMLTTVSMSIPKEDFNLSSELWRLKLTHLTDLVQQSLSTLETEEEH